VMEPLAEARVSHENAHTVLRHDSVVKVLHGRATKNQMKACFLHLATSPGLTRRVSLDVCRLI